MIARICPASFDVLSATDCPAQTGHCNLCEIASVSSEYTSCHRDGNEGHGRQNDNDTTRSMPGDDANHGIDEDLPLPLLHRRLSHNLRCRSG